MKKSESLIQTESNSTSSFAGRIIEESGKKLLNINRPIKVQPIKCYCDWVAIVPVTDKEESRIVLTSTDTPDIGIVVGIGPDVNKSSDIRIGELVKYSTKHIVSDLTGLVEFYSDLTVVLVKVSSLFIAIDHNQQVEICPSTTTCAATALES